MFFRANGTAVTLNDFFHGQTSFLICGGPSLASHDLGQLQQRGIFTMAVNNAAAVVRPQLWTCVDDPGNFCDAIWRDPAIWKFVPCEYFSKPLSMRDPQGELVLSRETVREMPTVFGYHRNEDFSAERFLCEPTFNWGNHGSRSDTLGNQGSRSVMYVALKLLYCLGVRRVYLLGCDFRMKLDAQNYAFEQDRSIASVKGNNRSYEILNVRLRALRPKFEEAGFAVFNCTPDSGLTVFPHVPFEQAVVTVEYNRQGDVILRTDQNGTVHAYGFDLLGRPSTDSVTTLGEGLDDTVLQIVVTYEIRGMVQNITSYDAASDGAVVNDVQRVYNGFRQLITEYQEHGGAVNTESSLNVQYSYADGSDNTIRLSGVTYPFGNAVSVGYGSSGGASDQLSRIDSLYWVSELDRLTVVQYAYLGLATPVQVTYPQPEVQYNLAVAIGDDLYTGLDEFGRVINLRWTNIAAPSSSSSSSSTSSSSSSSSDDDADDLVHLLYGYDQAGNHLWRQDVVAGSANLDELYTNDGLYRLSEMQRGQLTGGGSGITDLDFKQAWTLDPTGNWGEFKEYADGSTLSLDQVRTSTTVNEIEDIDNTTGAPWSQPLYDAAGNMIAMPQPNSPGDAFTGIFDAWNRLAQLGTGSGEEFVPVQVNAYDGRNFRITRLTYSGGELTETRDFYQSLSWQVLEERVSGTPERQYVWGVRYIDDLILRDGSNSGVLNERLYALQDANWNMVALCDASGEVQERFNYTAYGVPTALNPDFSAPYTGNDYEWTVLYTGRELDLPIGLYDYRNRDYHAGLGTFGEIDPIGYDGGDMNLYRYVNSAPQTALDPFGWDDHHWLPQLSGRGQGYVDKLCGKGTVKIHDFTTRLYGPIRGGRADPSRSAHSAATYLGDENTGGYSAIAKAIYASSKSCCQLLVSFRVLITATWEYLVTADNAGEIYPRLPSFFELHTYLTTPPSTRPRAPFKKLDSLIDAACKQCPDDRKVPLVVQTLIDKVVDETTRLTPEPPWMQEPGAPPTGDEFWIAAGITFLVRGLLFRAAAGATARGGGGTIIKKVVPTAVKSIANVLKPAA